MNLNLTAIFRNSFFKALIISFLATGLIASCNSSDKPIKQKIKKDKTTADDELADDGDDLGDEDDNGGKGRRGSDDEDDVASNVASDICDCIKDVDEQLSSRAKKIFIQASKSSNPQEAMQRALMNLDQDEQQTVAQEFQALQNNDIQGCMSRIDRKYPSLKNPSKSVQNDIADKVQDNCGDFAGALVKMGLKSMQAAGDDE